ncbi:MAG: DUF4878 domain-containing protein [bacterium]
MRKLVAVLGVLFVAAALCGCGGDKDKGEKNGEDGKDRKAATGDYSSPEAAFESVRKAAEDGDFDAVLACFTEDSAKKLLTLIDLGNKMAESMPEGKGKAKAAQEMGKEGMMKQMAKGEAKLVDIEIDGDTAKATVVTTDEEGNERKEPFEFKKVGGQWKIVVPITDEDIEKMKQQMQQMKKMMEGMEKMKDKIEEKKEKTEEPK